MYSFPIGYPRKCIGILFLYYWIDIAPLLKSEPGLRERGIQNNHGNLEESLSSAIMFALA